MNWNYCPSCGHRIYQHSNGDGCVHKTQVHHIARFTQTGVTVKHPLAERENDKLFDCTILDEVTGSPPPSWMKPGDYALIDNGNGGWSYEPVDRASRTCDCKVLHAQLVHT